MILDHDVSALRGIPAFEGLTAEAMGLLAVSSAQIRLACDEVLFKAGEAANAGYVLVSGSLELISTTSGHDKRICKLLPGALVGETALIIAGLRPVTARALEPSVVLRIPRHSFLQVLQGFPEAANALRDQIAGRVKSTLTDLDSLRWARLERPFSRQVGRA